MSKVKQLNLGVIKSAHAKEFTKKSVVLNIGGKDYEVLVDQKFSLDNLQELAKDGLGDFEKFAELDEIARINYFNYLLVKHFSSIKDELIQITDFEEEINTMKELKNLGIIDGITNHFLKEEVEKVGEYLKTMTANVKKYAENYDESEEIKALIDEEISKIQEENKS